ncbi:hypothetical protein BCR37DRAFT_241899 [Protomyces lactucae-debilis]|uniref:Uncharacterized protein n=1 Tax=Protomyces lactucae-debilis TaxID=2754530 RepID=A0A1Y2FPM8_PROLT|nr:uncharacterized protein BCR37DRAFT_241899 [Protomyces lactucae-debilis]ORY85557.1 hypothetical protein BCR37DRAFT_241899 [Protomyces lactucae-debilis]
MSGKVQSARQRQANEAFAKKEASKRGKAPEQVLKQATKKEVVKRSTAQKVTIGIVGTLIFGGFIYEFLKLFL